MRLWLLMLDVVGGAAVIGSYVHGIVTHEEPGRALWGGVPPSVRPLYQVSMLTATAGFLALSWFLLVRLPPETARFAGGRLGYAALLPIHALILIPSALWMPLTFRWLASPSEAGWLAIRVVLALVGVGALALVAAVGTMEPREPRLAWWAALVGACAFALQTALLDGLIWPALYRR